MIVGSAVFDQPTLGAGPGYACMQGGKPFRFSSMDDLDRDITWITNLSSYVFGDDHMTKKKNLRSSDFFGTPVQAISDEIGIEEIRSLESAKMLSTIFSRVVNLTERYMGEIKMADHHFGVFSSLQDIISLSIAGTMKTRGRVPPEVSEGVSHALSCPVPPSGEMANNDYLIRIPMQRISHLKTVISSPVPSGQWKQVDLSAMEDPLVWAANQDKPCLALVSLLKPTPLISSLVAKKTPRSTRVWIAHPEILAINHFMQVRVEKIYQAEFYGTHADSFRLPPPEFLAHDNLSISAGLFAESYLYAACSPDTKVFSNKVRACWFTSVSRSYVLAEIARLIANKFNVVGYDLSNILVSAPRSQIKRLVEYIDRNESLIFPAKYACLLK